MEIVIRKFDTKFIQYINLFEKITGVRTEECFPYNSCLIFVVKPKFMAKAIGENGANIKKMNSILNTKIKVIVSPSGIDEAENFIRALIYPVKIRKIVISEKTLIINGGSQAKATLIGRKSSKLNQLAAIVKRYFGIEKLKII